MTFTSIYWKGSNMTLYSQRDPRWANINLGTSNSSIGNYGCLITAAGMFFDKDPKTVNEILRQGGGYANGNLFYWFPACKLLGGSFIWRNWSYDNTAALWAIKNYGAVLVEVDATPIGSPRNSHWVIFVGNHKLWDPWNGKEEPTSKYPILKSLAVVKK